MEELNKSLEKYTVASLRDFNLKLDEIDVIPNLRLRKEQCSELYYSILSSYAKGF